MFKRFGFNTSTVGHTTLKVLAGVTLMYAEKGDKMVLLPFTLEVLVVMTVCVCDWLQSAN